MQLLVYNRTRGGLAEGSELDLLAKWSALQSRWPDFAEESRRDPDLVSTVNDWLREDDYDLAKIPKDWPDSTKYLVRSDGAFRGMFENGQPLQAETVRSLPIVR